MRRKSQKQVRSYTVGRVLSKLFFAFFFSLAGLFLLSLVIPPSSFCVTSLSLCSVYAIGAGFVRAETSAPSSSSSHHAFPWYGVVALVVAGLLAVALVLLLLFVIRKRGAKSSEAPAKFQLLQ